jgi:SAM-dependent methyltransferase
MHGPQETLPNDARPLELAYQACSLCGVEDGAPIAVGEDFEYHTSRDSFVAMRCDRCELVYLNPRPTVGELDRIYPPTYHAFQFSAENFGLAHRVRSRLEARRLLSYCKHLGDSARILDIGCGDGFHLRLLKQFGRPGWQLEGVDASDRAVMAVRNAGLNVHLGTLESADLAPNGYDLVLLIATIEHVQNPPAVLRAAARLLRPGGRAVIITDNTATLDFRLFGGRHWGGYHFPVNWVYSIRNRLVDRRAPRWLVERFSLKAPVALGVFTMLDGALQLFHRGALLKLIAEKPRALPVGNIASTNGKDHHAA